MEDSNIEIEMLDSFTMENENCIYLPFTLIDGCSTTGEDVTSMTGVESIEIDNNDGRDKHESTDTVLPSNNMDTPCLPASQSPTHLTQAEKQPLLDEAPCNELSSTKSNVEDQTYIVVLDSTCKYTVKALKELLVNNANIELKIAIKEIGRPMPQLHLTQRSITSLTRVRHFKEEVYEKVPWICGCEDSNRLYCFPCLVVFGKYGGDALWVKNGFMDLAHLSLKAKKHESSRQHICAMLDFNLLGNTDVRQLDRDCRLNIKDQNEQVAKNRYVLSKIIDCIKFGGASELALPGNRLDHDSLDHNLLMELVQFSAQHDFSLKSHLNTASVFQGTLKEIQHELLDCILYVCQENITEEIESAKYVSLIVDEISDMSSVFQFVIVLRYVLPSGQPVERFYHLENPEGQDAESVAKCICSNLNNVLKNSEKLVSQCYDGANVFSSSTGSVAAMVQQTFPNATLIHCYAHQLYSVISQATSNILDVRIFFSDLKAITSFFFNYPQTVAIFGNRVKRTKGLPRVSAALLHFQRRTVNYVFQYRNELIECMEEIQLSPEQQTIISKAGSLARLLRDDRFLFWLFVFHKLMPHVCTLQKQLQLIFVDALQTEALIDDFVESINAEKTKIDNEIQLVIENLETSHKRSRFEETCYVHNSAAKATCDIIAKEIKTRFSVTSSAAFLFCSEMFSVFVKTFPEKVLDDTVKMYSFLDKDRLRIELEIIYSRSHFSRLCSTVSFLQFFIDNDLLSSFQECHKLLLVVITMPTLTPEADRCFSTVQRIKTFLQCSMHRHRLPAFAMMAIEKDMISNIHNFNERVIDVFAKKTDRAMDFVFKKST